jgi:hypothetical protein
VESELPLAIDGGHEAAPHGVEGDVHPCRAVRHGAIEVGYARVHRIHTTADERTRHARFARVADAECLAHGTARPVGADEVIGFDGLRIAAVGRFHLGFEVILQITKAGHAPAIVHGHVGQRLGMAAQHRLDEFLVAAMR